MFRSGFPDVQLTLNWPVMDPQRDVVCAAFHLLIFLWKTSEGYSIVGLFLTAPNQTSHGRLCRTTHKDMCARDALKPDRGSLQTGGNGSVVNRR